MTFQNSVQRTFALGMALGMALLVATSAAQDSTPAEKASQESAAITSQQAGVPNKQPDPGEIDQRRTDKASQESSAASPQQESIANTKPEQVGIHSRREKVSYALGVALARDMRRQGLNLDLDLVTRALKDAVAGNKLLMAEADALATLKSFEEERQQDLSHAKKMLSEKNKKAGEAFFAENMKMQGVVTLPSGLQYKILTPGNGKRPALEDKVVCHYRSILVDGTVFDDSYKREHPVTVSLKGVIKGWSEALQIMPVGSKWELVVPPQLAYGEQGGAGGLIGPNATLRFEVELLSIEGKGEAGASQGR